MTARRGIPVGTTLRFFLLLALIAVSSLDWLRSVTAREAAVLRNFRHPGVVQLKQ